MSAKERAEREKKRREAETKDRVFEPNHDVILQKCACVLVPLILVFGIYIVLNGHLSPGGGFSGGAVLGSGLILYLNAFGFEKTKRFFTDKVYRRVTLCALTFYCLAKSYSFYTGANHLESGIPLGTPGAILSSGLILPLNICVGLVVACTMYAFYTSVPERRSVAWHRHLLTNLEETAAVILFGVGFTVLLLHRNLIKKIMGMNIMDTAVYLFLAAKGYINGRMVPIMIDGILERDGLYQSGAQRPGADRNRSVCQHDGADAGPDHPPL